MASQLLRSSDSTVLSSYVTSVFPKKDSIQSVKRLLSGAYHIQTIGTAPTKVEVTVITTRANMLIINGYQATGEDLKVIYDTNYYYIGVIEDQPSWEFLAPDIYKTTLTILSSSEGAV